MDHMRRLRASLGDAFLERGHGLGFTYPTKPKLGPLPWGAVVRLDYVLHSRRWKALRAWTGRVDGTSDHAYVVADLALEGS